MRAAQRRASSNDLGRTAAAASNTPTRRSRRSQSVGRSEAVRPGRIDEDQQVERNSLSPDRFGGMQNRRDSRLSHRLGYDAGDAGSERPPARDPNSMLPANFPAYIFVQPEEQHNQQEHGQNRNINNNGGKVQSPMARALRESDWASLCQHLKNVERLSIQDKLVCFMNGGLASPTPNDTSSTLLHTAVWKAPPPLVGILLDMLKQDRNDETRQLFLTQDPNGNTALHLWCANLETSSETSVLKRLVLGAPRALSVQNMEGDTPLHMFVSSKACCEALRGLDPKEDVVQSAVSVLTYLMDISLAETRILQDSSGATPLHVAIAHGAHESILAKLLEEAPMAATIADEAGMLPIHYAGARIDYMSPDFVRQLVQANPDGLVEGTVNDDTPLHMLVANAFSSLDVKKGADLDPKTCQIIDLFMGKTHQGGSSSNLDTPLTSTNNENLNPLHCCAFFEPPPALARHLMTGPDAQRAASMENDFGATPLHLASAQPDGAKDIITALGTKEAAATPDRLKRLPLHVASQNIHATRDVIEYLVELNPEAAAIKTQRGHLPLHLAAQSQAKEEVVQALIEAYPKGTEARSKSNNTPLHDASKYKGDAAVVKVLLKAYPDAVYIQNKHGNLPLHCATAYEAPDEVVLMLLEAWPDGASMQNRSQDSPLHFAAAHCSNTDTILPLLKAAPAAVLLLNGNGESPMDRARASNHSDIVRLLEKAAAEWTNKAANDPAFGMFSEDFDGAEF